MEKIFWNRMADVPTPLHGAAAKEHFRRTALWLHHFDQGAHWPVLHVDEMPGLQFNAKFLTHWLEHLSASSMPSLMRQTTQQFIHWRAILNPEVLPVSLPDPFAAFHFFCSIGGWFSRDHSGSINFINGGMSFQPMAYYLVQPPFMTDLEPTTILKWTALPGRMAEQG